MTLSAAPASVGKGGTATFTVSASAIVSQPLVVNYSMSGKATVGSDYMLNGPPSQVVIGAGESSAAVTLTVVTTKTKGKEKAVMTLSGGSGYGFAGAKKAKPAKPPKAAVTILNR